MLLHASPSSCCSSWSSSFSSCSSYANLAGTRNAKNLEQNTSQLEKNETYLVHWSALPPTCLSWNFKTKKWTHVHWIYHVCFHNCCIPGVQEGICEFDYHADYCCIRGWEMDPPMMTSRIGKARPLWYCGFQPPRLDRSADQQSVIHRWEEKVEERWNMWL